MNASVSPPISLFATALLGALLAWAAPAHAGSPTALEIATRVQQFYDLTATFQASFKQTYRI